MEVHQHSHTPRKKLKHYLFEFIMLFLAVFCGFLAENQREHFIEHKREKQYMRSMVQDLQADSAHFTFLIGHFEPKIIGLDTVITEFPKVINKLSIPFVRNLSHLVGYEDLVPNDRTIQQLKNAGAMRLIRKINVSDSIVEYDKKMKDLFIEEGGLAILFNRFMDMGEILDIEEIIRPILSNEYDELEKSKKGIILTSDKSIIGKYYYQMWSYQFICKAYLNQLKDIKSQGIRLIRLLKEEYNLK